VSFAAKIAVFALAGVAVLGLAFFLVMANREDMSELKAQCTAAQNALTLELPGAELTCAPADGEMGFVSVAVSLPVRPTGLTTSQTREKIEGIVKFRVKNVLGVQLTIGGEPVP